MLLCAVSHALVGRFSLAERLVRRVPATDDTTTALFKGVIIRVIGILKSGASPDQSVDRDFDLLSDHGYRGYARLLRAAISNCTSHHHRPRQEVLTSSEVVVLQHIALGLSAKEIAAESGRSVYTVRAHIQNAIAKLGCHGRLEAINVARNLGILEPEKHEL